MVAASVVEEVVVVGEEVVVVGLEEAEVVEQAVSKEEKL